MKIGFLGAGGGYWLHVDLWISGKIKTLMSSTLFIISFVLIRISGVWCSSGFLSLPIRRKRGRGFQENLKT
jgi:hypothetical protein